MANIDLTTNEWTELVFEGRNHEYGAYKLRKGTPARNIKAIIGIAILAALIIAAYVVKSAYDEYHAAHQKNEQVTELSGIQKQRRRKPR